MRQIRSMRVMALKIRQIMNLDRLGISLSLLCAVHCLLTPILVLTLPMFAGRAVENPLFHILMALLILPVGLWAFYTGYKHHRKAQVFWVGIPGLFIVAAVPLLIPEPQNLLTEPLLMICGSALVISAHWINRRSCGCAIHS